MVKRTLSEVFLNINSFKVYNNKEIFYCFSNFSRKKPLALIVD